LGRSLEGVYDMTVHMDGYEDHVENDMWITDTMVMNVELLETSILLQMWQ